MAVGGINEWMNATTESGRNPVSKHRIQPEENEQADARPVRQNLCRETKFSGANEDREEFILRL